MLTVDGVEAGYGRTTVLFGVSMEVPDDALVCVMGRNAGGKTTLIKTMMGVIKASRGTITLDARTITGLRSDQRVKWGLPHLPHSPPPLPSLPLLPHLRLPTNSLPPL